MNGSTGIRQAIANPVEREKSSTERRKKEAAGRPGTMRDGSYIVALWQGRARHDI